MANSPEKDADGAVRLTVKTDGSALADQIAVLSVTTTSKVGRIPTARIVLEDGDLPNQDFPLSADSTFEPGLEIEIAAGYDSSEKTIFKGIIVKHGIRAGNGPARLVVECRDKAAAMTVDRRNAIYIDKTDSEILSTLIKNCGLKPDVEATSVNWPELTQYYCTDWDFLMSRAEACGRLVIVEDGTVSINKPKTSGAVLTVTYGVDLIDFDADIDAASQLSGIKSSSWDPKTQEVVSGKEAPPKDVAKQGNLTGKTLAKVLGSTKYRQQTAAPLEKKALDDWSEAQQLKSSLARIKGSMKFQGSAKAKPGSVIELQGLGNRFNGDVLVTAVSHDISADGWVSEVDFGLDLDWMADRRDLSAPPASGLLPGVDGLQIGVVKKLHEDPGGENRIQVSVPLLEAETDGLWARMATFYASEKIGAFFVPEIGDEVILGFLNDDPSAPVILGSVYSSKHTPPHPLTAENFTKGLTTKSELKVEFDDEKKVISVLTPAKNSIVLDDDNKSITIADQSGNTVTLNEDGITLDSGKDITIKAGGKVAIEATGALSLKSNADVTVDGNNVTNTAKMGFTAKGSASAELSASGQTTVKGAMVMIN